MNTRTRMLALTLLLVAMILTACGGAPTLAPQSGSTPQMVPTITSQPGPALQTDVPLPSNSVAQHTVASQPTAITQPTATAQTGGENGITSGEGGVESAFVTYSDSAQGFVIGHPGPWTQDTSVVNGVKFVGGDGYMTVEFVTPPTGTDAITYAQSDVAAVSAAFPNFKQLSLAPSTEVKNAIILGFKADGKSAVTGKTFMTHNERYYMPLAGGRIAVLTVVGSDQNYDREGIRDIALTFKLLK